jgi:hypothetical protein
MLRWTTTTGTLLSLIAFVRLGSKTRFPETQHRPGPQSSVLDQPVPFVASGSLTTKDKRLTTDEGRWSVARRAHNQFGSWT